MSEGEADDRVLARLLTERHSCRAFQNKSVPEETIKQIVTMAQRTASWCNAQPWQVIITGGMATQRLRQALQGALEHQPAPDIAFPERYEGEYLTRRRVCGLALYDSIGIPRGDRVASAAQARQNFVFFGAPHVAIVTAPAALGTYGVMDCGAYAANFMLAAQSLGVASIAQAALATRSDVIRDHFGLGTERLIVCGISFGIAEPTAPANRFRTERASIAEAVELMLQ